MSETEPLVERDPHSHRKDVIRDVIWAAILSFALVCGGLVSKQMATNQGIFEALKLVVWWKFLGSLFVQMPMFALHGSSIIPNPFALERRQLLWSILLAVSSVGYFGLLQLSVLMVDFMKLQTFLQTETIFILILSAIFLKESVSFMEAVLCLLTGIFVALATEPHWLLTLSKSELSTTLQGILLAVLCAAVSAVADFSKRFFTDKWYKSIYIEPYFHLLLLFCLWFFPCGFWPNCQWGILGVFALAVGSTALHCHLIEAYRQAASVPIFTATYLVLAMVFSLVADLMFFRKQMTITWFGYLMSFLALATSVLSNVYQYFASKREIKQS